MIFTTQSHRITTQGYCNQCGIADDSVRKQIFDFADGIFDLGLWNNFVCWPLRSAQNRGTGTTVFSLGGLGTFNGSMVNGPSWTAEGIDFSPATTTHISTSLRVNSTAGDFPPKASFCAAQISGSNTTTLNLHSGTEADYNLRRAYNDPYRWWRSDHGMNSVPSSIINFSPSTHADVVSDNTFRVVGVNYVNENTFIFKDNTNGTEISSTPTTTTFNGWQSPGPSYLRIGNTGWPNPSNSWPGKISFVSSFTTGLNATQFSQLRSLYKSTLGQGLGLP